MTDLETAAPEKEPSFLRVRFKVVRESAVHGLQEGHRDQNRPGILHQIRKASHIVWCLFCSYRKPQAMLVEEKSRSVETVEKEPPFAIIRSG